MVPFKNSGLSATHEEFREAKGQKELLAFVEAVADREPAQDEFVREVQDWSGGVFTESFSTAPALRQAVTRLLHQREVEDARGGADVGEMTSRCLSLLPGDDYGFRSGQVSLMVAVAPGPRQAIFRPTEIEDPAFANQLFGLCLQGPHGVLDRREGTETEIDGNSAILRQQTSGLNPTLGARA